MLKLLKKAAVEVTLLTGIVTQLYVTLGVSAYVVKHVITDFYEEYGKGE